MSKLRATGWVNEAMKLHNTWENQKSALSECTQRTNFFFLQLTGLYELPLKIQQWCCSPEVEMWHVFYLFWINVPERLHANPKWSDLIYLSKTIVFNGFKLHFQWVLISLSGSQMIKIDHTHIFAKVDVGLDRKIDRNKVCSCRLFTRWQCTTTFIPVHGKLSSTNVRPLNIYWYGSPTEVNLMIAIMRHQFKFLSCTGAR